METLHVIAPLDLNEGKIYKKLVHEDVQSSIIENMYNIIRHKEVYVNPTKNG